MLYILLKSTFTNDYAVAHQNTSELLLLPSRVSIYILSLPLQTLRNQNLENPICFFHVFFSKQICEKIQPIFNPICRK